MCIKVAAHRGNVAEYSENTMSAYKSAYEIGNDMIELDLRMTKDGKIVLIHDSDLAHTARTIRDMVELGAELITSNEPTLMMAELKKAGLRTKENGYG